MVFTVRPQSSIVEAAALDASVYVAAFSFASNACSMVVDDSIIASLALRTNDATLPALMTLCFADACRLSFICCLFFGIFSNRLIYGQVKEFN